MGTAMSYRIPVPLEPVHVVLAQNALQNHRMPVKGECACVEQRMHVRSYQIPVFMVVVNAALTQHVL